MDNIPYPSPSISISSGRVRGSVLEETSRRNPVPLLTVMPCASACEQAAACLADVTDMVSPLLAALPQQCPSSSRRRELTNAAAVAEPSLVGAGGIRHACEESKISGASPRRPAAIRPDPGIGDGSAFQRLGLPVRTWFARQTQPQSARCPLSPVRVFPLSTGARMNSAASGECVSGEFPASRRSIRERRQSSPPAGLRNAARKAQDAKRNAHERPPTGGEPDRHC